MVSQDLLEKVRQAVKAQEAASVVSRLVQTPSHWADEENRERPIARLLQGMFENEGIEAELVNVVDERPNVIAKLPGTGGGKSLMFNGHIDTVPPFGMKDPFGGKIVDGKLYGRGAADMKSGVGTMAYALMVLKRLGIRLKGDLYFAGVVDEDAVGSRGTKHIIKNGPLTDYAIVGEPTSNHPVIAHKGHDNFYVTFLGKSNHSSTPKNGVNAIFAAADFVHEIDTSLNLRYSKMQHPFVTPPSVNTGLIQGCAKANKTFLDGNADMFAGIIPDVCTVYIDVRWSPYQTLEGITNDLKEIAEAVKSRRPGINCEFHYYEQYPHPAMEIPEDCELVRSIKENMKLLTGRDVTATGENYWGDTGILHNWGHIPCLMFGPGDIGCAHSDLEYVNVDELKTAVELYVLTALDICGYEQ